MKVMENQLSNYLNDTLTSIETSIYSLKNNNSSRIIISTYQKVTMGLSHFNKNDFDLIICDELDSMPAEVNKILEFFDAYIVGFVQLSRGIKVDFKTNELIYSYSLKDAVLEGTLAVVNSQADTNTFKNIFEEINLKLQGIAETLAVENDEITNVQQLSYSLGVINETLKEHQELFQALIKKNLNKSDLTTLARKKEQIEIFKLLLLDSDYFNKMKNENGNSAERVWQNFFELNKWIFGYGLNYIFNSPLDNENFEQVINGYNFFESGKRVDALMKTRGLINSMCFVEMKTHLTPLLDTQYRSECWSVSKELTGAISQIQRYKYKSIKTISGRTDMKTKEGNPTGEIIFNYNPKSIIIVGNLNEFITENGINEDKLSSFEMFRKSIEGIEIITFDELFERARFIIEQ
ncbi:hypothetical protein D3C76_618680 [compost metagenome]